MMEIGAGALPHYAAFLSYSHADDPTARRLHRWLEGYRLPRRLIGLRGEYGEVPLRLKPIFRDIEELPAAVDLSAQVRAALADSAALVVLCSPSAAASKWVTREISYFRSLHPDRPIFAALIAGEPSQAIPPELAAHGEPAAADLRGGREAQRLGMLKLVSGLCGIGLGQLVQRDAQRRIRRISAVTLVSLVTTAAMAFSTASAISSGAEAERQRREAESLVEFMLTDLRDRLEGVGRLDILMSVNRRALQHYAGQRLERLKPGDLERRARLLHAMGEDEERRGDLVRALDQFTEARRTTAALLARSPDDPDRIYAHAQSEFWAALIDWRRNRPDAAEAGFRRYSALAARLHAKDPGNPEWMMEAGYAANNLGMVALRSRHDPVVAEKEFSRSIGHFANAAKRRPRDTELQLELADAYGWLADAQRAQGHGGDALANRTRQRGLLIGLTKADPLNQLIVENLAAVELAISRLLLAAGRVGEAQERLAGVHARSAGLLARDPENDAYRLQNQIVGLFLARALLGDPALPRRRLGEVAALLAGCPAKAGGGGDPEVVAMCDVVAAALARRLGGVAPAAEASAGSTPSPRWGIDFRAEAAAMRAAEHGR
ncbi:MAG: TIR domain-containing protein [Novosphingobium sp.]